jgi:hypothetical protein
MYLPRQQWLDKSQERRAKAQGSSAVHPADYLRPHLFEHQIASKDGHLPANGSVFPSSAH